MSVQISDLELLEALRNFALSDIRAEVARFRQSMLDWGDDWREVTPTHLPAADFLDDALDSTNTRTRALVEKFRQHKNRLRWEQSYRKEDGLVPDTMLNGYAFAEIIGLHGPFVSERIRAGIGVWGPQITYPRHRHEAEEIYIVLAGSAEFRVGNCAETSATTGDVVLVESNTPHEFRTTEQSLVVCYLWQAGNLRQISSFE